MFIVNRRGASRSPFPGPPQCLGMSPASPPPSPGNPPVQGGKGLSQVRMFAQLFCYKQKPLTQKSSVPPGLFSVGSICPCTVVLTPPHPPNHVQVTLGSLSVCVWGVLTVSLTVQAEKQRPLTLYGKQTVHRAERRALEGSFQHRC